MTRLSLANTRESHLGAFNLVFGTVHLKRVISPADVQSPLDGISQTNKAYLEVFVLSSGLAVAALIMVEGRLFILVIYFFLRMKSWVSRVGGLGSASSA